MYAYCVNVKWGVRTVGVRTGRVEKAGPAWEAGAGRGPAPRPATDIFMELG